METRTSYRQRGMSLIGLIFVGLIVVFLLILGSKVVPAVVEYIAIERAVQKIKNEGTTVREIQAAFERHAQIDDITSISYKDLEITKDGDRIILSVEYSVKVPLVGNLSALMDFNASSDK